MTLAAARAGAKAVICEKPMAVSLGDVDAMLDACQQSGTKLLYEMLPASVYAGMGAYPLELMLADGLARTGRTWCI